MSIRSISNTFNRGELDPSLYARDDLDLFNKGCQKLRNMVPLWTGAATIAAGTIYIDTIVDREDSNAVIQDSDYVKVFDFTYDADAEIIYTIVIRKSNSYIALDIYYNDTLQTTLDPTTYTVLQNYAYTEIPNIYFAKGHDRIILLHETIQFAQVTNTGGHTSWSVALLSLRVPPTFDFTLIPNSGATNYNSFTFTLTGTPGTVGATVTITSSSAMFSNAFINGLFLAEGGVARITAYTSTTQMDGRVIEPFTVTSIAAGTAIVREPLFSASRGWPARGSFFLNRLILGRTNKIKNIVTLSTAGVFDNFDEAELDALTSFSVTLTARGEQSLQSIVADDSLLFTTTNKIFAQNPLVETPVNIENAYFAPQSQSPSTNLEAVAIDNQTLFVSSDRTAVVTCKYITNDGRYITVPATMLNNSLVDFINSHSTWEPPSVDTRLYFATQDNGTMLMYSTLQDQNVSGWSLRTTVGSFKQTIGDGKQAHVVVEREINTGATYEQTLDYVYLSDSTFKARYDVTEYFDSATGVSTVTVLEEDNNYILIGNQAPFTGLDVDLSTVASSDCSLTFEYLDLNGAWNSFSPTDGTSGFTVDGEITWSFTDVANWAPYEDEPTKIENKYWIRIKRTANSVTTVPIMGHVEINTSTRLYLERQDFGEYMDSVETQTSDANGDVTGLTHLAGHRVFAIVNGATVGHSFVDDSGETTIKALSASAKIGLQYKPELVPMPLYAQTQTGDATYSEKYVQDLYIDYVDSLYLQAGVKPQLTDIPNMPLGNYTLGQSVPPQSGIYRISPCGDWSPRQQYTITQSQPGAMTIIGVGYNVEVS